ncbi:MAG: OmpA family protein, partial [Saprospiraceae bacterium]|nr:OmpA family protein [Saprospiraceae bacterium]
TLDELVKVLEDNPQINIQLSSHTDCRGTEDYNQELSQKRAESVVNYLIAKSIKADRLIPKGYGESLLVDTCECDLCTESQHQSNRRTTFKIIKR